MFHDGRYIQPEEEDALATGSPRTRLSVALEAARTLKDCRKMRTVARPLPPPGNVAAVADEDDDAIDASETARYTALRSQLVDHFAGWRR